MTLVHRSGFPCEFYCCKTPGPTDSPHVSISSLTLILGSLVGACWHTFCASVIVWAGGYKISRPGLVPQEDLGLA